MRSASQVRIARYPGVQHPVQLALTKLVTGIVRSALVQFCLPGDEMGAARLKGHLPLCLAACFPFPPSPQHIIHTLSLFLKRQIRAFTLSRPSCAC